MLHSRRSQRGDEVAPQCITNTSQSWWVAQSRGGLRSPSLEQAFYHRQWRTAHVLRKDEGHFDAGVERLNLNSDVGGMTWDSDIVYNS
jgi:hypothetical protein